MDRLRRPLNLAVRYFDCEFFLTYFYRVNIVSSEESQSKMMQVVEWAYEKAVVGVAGLDSAAEIADSYKKSGDSLIDQANSLIRWQNTKAATSGFITGLGGLITLPIAIPANVASVIYVQIRMIAAIAYLGGYDLKDDRVKTLVYACLVSNSAKDILKDIGIGVGNKLAMSFIKKIPFEVIKKINTAVGFRLVTKSGTTGIINLTKSVPLLGGFIGGGFDLYTTNKVGDVARDTFIINRTYAIPMETDGLRNSWRK